MESRALGALAVLGEATDVELYSILGRLHRLCGHDCYYQIKVLDALDALKRDGYVDVRVGYSEDDGTCTVYRLRAEFRTEFLPWGRAKPEN